MRSLRNRLLAPAPFPLFIMSSETRNAAAGGVEREVVGHNAEVAQPALAGAICAERAAMLQALGGASAGTRLSTLRKVIVVSDAARPITPGNLCREFLSEYGAPSTPIVLASITGDNRAVDGSGNNESAAGVVEMVSVTLGDLYPHPPLLAGVAKSGVVAAASALMATASPNPFASSSSNGDNCVWEWPASQVECEDLYRKTVEAATRATLAVGEDPNAVRHPLAIAAGVLLPAPKGPSDARFRSVIAIQRTALEFGCTADPVVQLLPDLLGRGSERAPSQPPLLLIADQTGLLHAPTAPARALLAEHGRGTVVVAVHARKPDGNGVTVERTTITQLSPALPAQLTTMCAFDS
eukprot:SAG31_NODE_264_length_18835_cov_7.543553_1_plen_353_part_00